MLIKTRDDLEQMVIGGLLYGHSICAYRLNDSDFANPFAQEVFYVIRKKLSNDEKISVDIITDCDVRTSAGFISKASDAYSDAPMILADFEKLVDKLIVVSDLNFAKIELDSIIGRIKSKDVHTTEDVLNELTSLTDVLGVRHVQKPDITVGESIINAFKLIEQNRGKRRFGFGLPKVDFFLYNGIPRGEYVLMAARTNIGKSMLAMLPALTAAGNGESVLYCTNEMTKEQMALRMLANRAGVEMGIIEGIKAGSHVDFQAIADAEKILRMQDIILLPNCFKISQIEETLQRRERYGKPVGLVVIDLIGKMKGEQKKQYSSGYDELSEISGRAFEITKKYKCTVIGIVQINREGAMAAKISLEHLKGCGSFEEDADKVFLMWGDKDDYNLRHLSLAKNRTGRKDEEFVLRMDGEKMRFYEV